jgi:membrane associated rhomboid family serine protease
MRRPPPLTDLPRFPIVGGTALLAAGVTAAYQGWLGPKVDISVIREGPAIIEKWELWRLVTPVLPHGGPLHLIFNVIWLWNLGAVVEETFGHARTLAIVLLLALGSCAAEYALFYGGVGLSGVVYGLFGMLWVLDRRDERFRGAMDRGTALFMVGWFFLCIVTTAAGVMDVANVAHGVGAVLGALLGFAIAPRQRIVRILGAAALVLLVGASVAGALFGRPWVNVTKTERGYELARLGARDLEKNRDEDAVRRLRQAVRADEEQDWAWYNLGVAYTRLGMYEEAAHAFERAAQLDSNDPDYAGAAARARARAAAGKAERKSDDGAR